MPDIREVLNALEEKDRHLYAYIRTAMRSTYLSAVSDVIGIQQYSQEDDAFMDLIDIKLAILFERAGKFNNAKGSISDEDAIKIENEIVEAASTLKLTSKSQSQRVLESYAPNGGAGSRATTPQAPGSWN